MLRQPRTPSILRACGACVIHPWAAALLVAMGTVACHGDPAPDAAAAEVSAADAPLRLYPQGVSRIAGFSLAPRDFADGESLDILARDGFHWIRFDALWHLHEPLPGVFDFRTLDAEVTAVLDAGLEPLLILAYGNPYYSALGEECRSMADNSDDYRCPPDNPADFARYAAALARHFAGRVRVYEVWNEANGWFRFWPTRAGGDPDAYGRLVAAAADSVHAACSDCLVLSGGLVFHEVPPVVIGQADFMPAMRTAVPDLFARVDGVGVHHYTFYPPVNAPEDDGFPERPLADMLEDTRTHCDCDRPLWITETGWSTAGGLSELGQARYGLRGMMISLAAGAESWLWWSLRRLDGQQLIAAQEAWFGVWNLDGGPRPVYLALRRFLAELGAATAVRDVRNRYGLDAPAEWAVEFTMPGGDRRLVVWANIPGVGRTVAPLQGRGALNLVSGESGPFSRIGPDPLLITVD